MTTPSKGSQDRDADGFVMQPRPDSSQNDGAKKKGQESRLAERIDKLMQQQLDQKDKELERMKHALVKRWTSLFISADQSVGLLLDKMTKRTAALMEPQLTSLYSDTCTFGF
jgi:hypothetical protein